MGHMEREKTMKYLIGTFLSTITAACFMACNVNQCGSGEQDCGGGYCAPPGYQCCSQTTSCPSDTTCGPGNTCLSSYVNQGVTNCEYCASIGEECCINTDLSVDCAPLGHTCCSNHTNCPAGTACLTNGQCS